MPFLMRLSLPDVPGSLGRVATAIGEAGGDIDAIEIVERRNDGTAVDDVLFELSSGGMPDTVISVCNGIRGVDVLWISRYAAGGQLFLDLEVVEALTQEPEKAGETIIDLLPVSFRAGWAAALERDADGRVEVVRATEAAPSQLSWHEVSTITAVSEPDSDTILVAAPFGDRQILLAREGGPQFLNSELARIRHLLELARSISR